MGNKVSQIDSAEPHPTLSKDRQRRAQKQVHSHFAEREYISELSPNIHKPAPTVQTQKKLIGNRSRYKVNETGFTGSPAARIVNPIAIKVKIRDTR